MPFRGLNHRLFCRRGRIDARRRGGYSSGCIVRKTNISFGNFKIAIFRTETLCLESKGVASHGGQLASESGTCGASDKSSESTAGDGKDFLGELFEDAAERVAGW